MAKNTKSHPLKKNQQANMAWVQRKKERNETKRSQLEELQQEIKSSIKQMDDGLGIPAATVRERIKNRRSGV